jgi:hypothetical protein
MTSTGYYVHIKFNYNCEDIRFKYSYADIRLKFISGVIDMTFVREFSERRWAFLTTMLAGRIP